MKAISSIPILPALKLAAWDLPMTGKMLWSLMLRRLMPFLLAHEFVRDDRATPGLVSIKITDRCNLRCPPCAQWGEHGYNLGRDFKHMRRAELPVAAYRKLVADAVASGHRPLWYLWGGEPLMYGSILDVTAAIREAELFGSLVTNGFRLKEYAAELVRQGWNMVDLSQDGTPEIHRRCRPGANPRFDSYQMLREGAVALVEEKRRQAKRFPILQTLTCITALNQHHLVETVLDAQQMGADAMTLYPAWFTTLEDGLKHEAEFERRFGHKPFMWKGYLADCHTVDVAALQQELRRLKADRRIKIPWTLMPDLAIEQLVPYYQEHSNFLGYGPCTYPWTYLEIQPNGDVATCRDYGDFICGNITQGSIFEIFNNERYQKFRASLRQDGMMPICSRCCGLMGF